MLLVKLLLYSAKQIFFSTGNDVNVINTAVKIKKLQAVIWYVDFGS